MAKVAVGNKIFKMDINLVKFLLVPAGVFVLFLMSLFLVILPQISNIQDMNAKAAEKNKSTQAIQDKINYLNTINPDDLKTNAERLNSAIFAEKNSYYLIDVIRGIADQYGFQINDFSLSPGEVKQEETDVKKTVEDVYTRIPVDIILVGPRAQFLTFIEALEKSLPILSMDEFQVSTEQNSTKLELTLVSYYIPTKSIADISKLTLADLTLTKDESSTLSKLDGFKTVSTGTGTTATQQFVKYTRPNPFAL